jgi:putative addiction module killer protein
VDYELETTAEFDAWLDGLKDAEGRKAVAMRLLRAQSGLFGDCAPVGEGVRELRVHVGPGYRACFVIRRRRLVVILCGGSKKTQSKDIVRAKAMAAELE